MSEIKRDKVSSVEDLDVFRRAYAASLEMHRASLQFPSIEQRYGVADQLRRASKSICANLGEGFGKQRSSVAEFRRYVIMAVGSADEMQVWIRYSVDLGYVDGNRGEAWRDEYRQIARMLQSLYGRAGGS